jgi:hypothetical protein
LATLNVKSNTPGLGWQVTVIDTSTANRGHPRKTTGGTTVQLTNPLHVKAVGYDVNLESTTNQIIAIGTDKTTGSGTDIPITFCQAGSYNDALTTGYTITVTFAASPAGLPDDG